MQAVDLAALGSCLTGRGSDAFENGQRHRRKVEAACQQQGLAEDAWQAPDIGRAIPEVVSGIHDALDHHLQSFRAEHLLGQGDTREPAHHERVSEVAEKMRERDDVRAAVCRPSGIGSGELGLTVSAGPSPFRRVPSPEALSRRVTPEKDVRHGIVGCSSSALVRSPQRRTRIGQRFDESIKHAPLDTTASAPHAGLRNDGAQRGPLIHR